MNMTDAYKTARRRMNTCALCGAPAVMVGCFVPEDPSQWSGGSPPRGKTRTYWYGLCARCAAEGPEAAEKVEARLLRQKAQMN
jgi:hypothetical protein